MVLATLTERQFLAELAARYQLATAQISSWKLYQRKQTTQVFEASTFVLEVLDVVDLIRGHWPAASLGLSICWRWPMRYG